tara:strand:- start:21666 stop:22106 length:441 start_codon:yes stop_codon:yes gene_type:complete
MVNIILYPINNASVQYNLQKPYFNKPGCKWFGTKKKREKIYDYFGFVDIINNQIEIFKIDNITVPTPNMNFIYKNRFILTLSELKFTIPYHIYLRSHRFRKIRLRGALLVPFKLNKILKYLDDFSDSDNDELKLETEIEIISKLHF